MVARAAVAAALPLCAAATLTACAASSHAGIPFGAGAADPELQGLARRAQAGDKHAQLELGIRYEEGRGVEPDEVRAAKLYRAAAAPSGGIVYVYAPPIVKGQPGSLHRIHTGPARAGLTQAKERLARLRGTKGRSSAVSSDDQLEDAR